MKKRKLIVVTSLDVEEEGLFSGSYRSRDVSVSNVRLLPKLAPLTTDLALPLTLFCAYAVFDSAPARETVAHMRSNFGAEIGAHLHHWSTPPFTQENEKRPLRTDRLPKELFIQRLQALLETGRQFQGAPITSFRMGRWDLKARLLPILAENGILVDSSVCPLRATPDGPDHFMAPSDPYLVNLGNGKTILEAPITQIPLFTAWPKLWKKFRGGKSVDKFHFFGALSANPFWHNGAIMRLATILHARRGGRVLNLFWHSSEMLPGASPHVPNEKAADRMLAKIFSFCGWLNENFEIQGMTASQLASLNFTQENLEPGRDW